MLRGTRIIEDASKFNEVVSLYRLIAQAAGYTEIIVPSIWEQGTFTNKAGPEILNTMYTFKDKGDRDICLIPEATAIIQEMYKADWQKRMPRPIRVCYLSRCYRYDRPQKGRYREFWQFGCEILGGDSGTEGRDYLTSGQGMLGPTGYVFKDSVKRGLDYYIEDGFEAECESLGA